MHLKIPLLISLLFATVIVSAQCNLTELITICDMTTIDIDDDNSPDGLNNLYDRYNALPGVTPISSDVGYWFDPNYNYALEEGNGILHVWDLSHSSSVADTYEFQLIDMSSSCTDGILVTLRIVLGPFSGFAVPTVGENDVNVEVCDSGIDPCFSSSYFDLYQALLSTPSPHTNGVWHYEGSNPYFIGIDLNRYLMVNIPYQPGPPLVDEATFELVYIVPGITPCATSVETHVTISVIRAVFSGAANNFNLCESEVQSGDFDAIDLRDDAFLINEDIEGIWMNNLDETGQITGPADSVINLSEVHADLVATNPRFGCISYDYVYHVQSRSAVCSSSDSYVSFRFFEDIRPFQQEHPEEFCLRYIEEDTVDLYDYISFTDENGVTYDYPEASCTNWQFVSGPSSLGLITNTGDLCDLEDDPNYSSNGTVHIGSLTDADVGTYVFRYTVLPEYNCAVNLYFPELINQPPFGCEYTLDFQAPCDPKSTLVTLIVHPYNYPGEDTEGLAFCASEDSVDLFSLLQTNGEDDPIYLGPDSYWENTATGETIEAGFEFPDIDGEQEFNFSYHITANNCLEEVDLSFTVYEPPFVGDSVSIAVCEEAESFELFELLDPEADTNGIWTLPDASTSDTNILSVDPTTASSGNYSYTVPNNGACETVQATVSVTINHALNPGADVVINVCKTDDQINLFSALEAGADGGGTFIDMDGVGTLAGSILDFSTLSIGTYHFEYNVQASPECVTNTALITLNLTETTAPDVADQTFCFSDSAIVGDLVATTALPYQWYASATASTPLYSGSLLQNGTDYFVAAVSPEGCVSERVWLTVTLTAPELPIIANQTFCESDEATVADLFFDSTLAYHWYDIDYTATPLDNDIVLQNGEAYYIAVTDESNCVSERAVMHVSLTAPDPPEVSDQVFCVSDEATLADLNVVTDLNYAWYLNDTDTESIDESELLEDEMTYYIAGTDENGCVSERADLWVSLTQFGEGCENQNPIDPVVSPNNDSIHDELDLYELPETFPNFEIKIFNRYGTVVYIGNANTPAFDGTSNVAGSIGNQLPTGVYFYTLFPNNSIMEPFQGDFYLSR